MFYCSFLLFWVNLMQHPGLSSSHGGIIRRLPAMQLRGGGWNPGRGVKRSSRDDDWRPADQSLSDITGSATTDMAKAGMMRPTKVARSAWSWGWGPGGKDSEDDGGLATGVLDKLASSASRAWQGAMRLFSWPRASSDRNPTTRPSLKKRSSNNTRLVFSGDQDRPAAIKRQIDFYFSDSNLPSGACDHADFLVREQQISCF
jgi:hypothetical protein